MTVLLEYILMTALLEYLEKIKVPEKWSSQCQTRRTMGSSPALLFSCYLIMGLK